MLQVEQVIFNVSLAAIIVTNPEGALTDFPLMTRGDSRNSGLTAGRTLDRHLGPG